LAERKLDSNLDNKDALLLKPLVEEMALLLR
jgi:hypothetical protein